MIIPILIMLGIAYLGIRAGSKPRAQQLWEQTPDNQARINLRTAGFSDRSIDVILQLRSVFGNQVLQMDKPSLRSAILSQGWSAADADRVIAEVEVLAKKVGVVVRGNLPRPKRNRISATQRLTAHLHNGLEPSPWLVTEAMREAFDRGDWEQVSEIAEMFGEPEPPPVEPAPQEQSEPTQAVEITSPLEGVEPGDWEAFASALATRDPGHQTDRYVGKYEQSRSRLKSLGIEAPTTSEEQDRAIAADMSDYWTSGQKLIRDFAGEVVVIRGEPHAVTASGVLGLLKSAGPQGARSWLESEGDREKFPRTTETFIRTNGCF